MNSKEFYKHYVADDNLSPLSYAIREHILRDKEANHVFEFGCGTGKNLVAFDRVGIPTIGLDISMQNILIAKYKHGLPCVICADETYLRNMINVDYIFTVSVLDHFPEIDSLIGEFKRIANKAVFLAEPSNPTGTFYYKHDYEKFGFKKVHGFKVDETNCGKIYLEDPEAFAWRSEDDGNIYFLYKWEK